MRELSLVAVLITIFFPVVKAYRNQEEVYQLPFLFSVAILVFILPTLVTAVESPQVMSDSQYIRHNFFATLCIWSAFLGYSLYKYKGNSIKARLYVYDEKKLTNSICVFLFVSFLAQLVIGNVDFGNSKGGIFAVLVFPARMMRPATIMLFIIYLLKPDKKKLVFLAISLLFSLQTIIVYGRRSEVFNLFITIVFPLFFIKNIKAKRSLIIPGISLSIFVFIFFPVARVFTMQGDFDKVFTLSPTEIFTAYLSAEKSNEVVDASKNMEVAAISGNYNYGLTAYNSFVYQFASSTFFGKDFKDAVTVEPNLNLVKLRDKYSVSENDYFRFWLTPTGFAAIFCEFGWYGCIAFFIFGVLVKRFYSRAQARENLPAIMFYSFFATFILYAIYDSMTTIPTFIIMYLIVYYVSIRYAGIKSNRYSKMLNMYKTRQFMPGLTH